MVPVIQDSDEEDAELDLRPYLTSSSHNPESDTCTTQPISNTAASHMSPATPSHLIPLSSSSSAKHSGPAIVELQPAENAASNRAIMPLNPYDDVPSPPPVKKVARSLVKSVASQQIAEHMVAIDMPHGESQLWPGVEQSSTIMNSTSDLAPPTATEQMSDISVLSASSQRQKTPLITPRTSGERDQNAETTADSQLPLEPRQEPVILLPAEPVPADHPSGDSKTSKGKKAKRKRIIVDEDEMDELSNDIASARSTAKRKSVRPAPEAASQPTPSTLTKRNRSERSRRAEDRAEGRGDSRQSENRALLQDMGFRASQVDRALKEHPRSVNDALDYLNHQETVNEATEEPTNLVAQPDADQAVPVVDQAVVDLCTQEDVEHCAQPGSLPDEAVEPKATVIAGDTKAAASGRKRGRPKKASASDATPQKTALGESQVTKGRRGRPRKSDVTDNGESEAHGEGKTSAGSDENKSQVTTADMTGSQAKEWDRKPLQEVEVNAPLAENEGDSNDALPEHKAAVEATDGTAVKSEPTDEATTATPTSKKKRASLADICARTGQTHRVGLSKRMRIESLLRKTQVPKANLPKAEHKKSKGPKKAA